MIKEVDVNKPKPIAIDKDILFFVEGGDVKSTIKALEKGEYVLISDVYSDGLLLLKELHTHLGNRLPNKSYKDQQAYRTAYQKLSNLIVLEVSNHKLRVKKAPSIGWLNRFYPENNHFFLSLPQIQGMNSSWQWYQKGISVPVLRNRLHPYYGVYFPTRFEDLLIFDNWLKRYEGPKKTAMDVGTNSGILSLQLVQHGFQKVFASDTNPNAIFGLTEFMGTSKLSRKIELDLGEQFGKWEKPTELIVFNPPKLPASHELDYMEKAIYYEKDLFSNFFAAAKERLLPDGKLLVLFSNLGQISGLTTEHPIEKEIAEGGRFKLERCFTKTIGTAPENTKGEPHWRSTEQVELWELSHV